MPRAFFGFPQAQDRASSSSLKEFCNPAVLVFDEMGEETSETSNVSPD
jgi:hypothetical protein